MAHGPACQVPVDNRSRRPAHVALRLLALALLAALGACTTPGPPAESGASAAAGAVGTAQPRWWYLRFRFARADGGEADSFLDGLVADRLLSPVIERYAPRLELWRFHRRWPDDAVGHQFSFILYAPDAVAAGVIAQVQDDPLLGRLRGDGHLRDFRAHPGEGARAATPGGTSDAGWPPEIQREWPKFIMGASRMWLGLVQGEAAKQDTGDLYARYQAVQSALDRLWFAEGNHAFFHHLSALFGYRPLRVIRRDVMTF